MLSSPTPLKPKRTTSPPQEMLSHGGRLRKAARQYGIPLEHWLDVSTGINPNGWPVPPTMPADCWARLPEDDDGLREAAADYYLANSKTSSDSSVLLPVAGSQAAIQALPRLQQRLSRVRLLSPSYAEHAHHWRAAGHHVEECGYDELLAKGTRGCDVLVLVNPNNPTGHLQCTPQLMEWRQELAAKGGWLVIDEAFADCDPNSSLRDFYGEDGLIVLRSMGKFFGLAGIRIGFVAAEPMLLNELQCQLGPWPISGPSRWVAQAAFQDKHWQERTRSQLQLASKRLQVLLASNGLTPRGGCALFQWCPHPQAVTIYRQLAQEAILCRLFDDDQQPSLRFGLPADEASWQRLESALARCSTARVS